MAEMLKEFAESLPTVLLFLRNVCKISVLEWRVGDDAPTVVQEAMITNMTAEIEAKRSLQHTSLGSSRETSARRFSSDGIVCDYPLNIEARNCVFAQTKEYTYLIMNQLGGGQCTQIACDPTNASQRLVPWGGVAVLTTADAAISAAAGLAFCFLPLPTHTKVMKPKQHAQLLPQALPPAPWDSLTLAFFSLIRCKPCLYSEAGGGQWVCPMESMVVRSSYSNSKQLEQLLIDDGFPIVRNLAEDLERVLVKTGTIPSYLEPQGVREAYTTKISVHARNQEAIQCLLSFILSDLSSDQLSALVGVNFLPVANGTLKTFERCSKFDPDELKYLCAMGFSRQHAVYALTVAGDNGVETALNWLLQNPNPSVVSGERANTPFFIPTREELELLEKARGHLINIDAISSSGIALLSSERASKDLNIQKLDCQGFEDMLAVVLPSAWFGQLTVPWNETADGNYPNEEWFRQLWKYIGKSDNLSALKDKWPIIPTSSGILTQLSISAGVLSAELIPNGCLQCLQKLQVRLLLPNIFASFQPNPDVWQFIHQPTATGCLSCIGAILGTGALPDPRHMNEIFKYTNKDDREHLLKFLKSGVSENFSAHNQWICCNLPIFPGFRHIHSNVEHRVQWEDYDGGDDSMGNGFSPSYVSLAEIKEKHQEPLVCMGIDSTFLDDNFVFVKEGDSALVEFLLGMGAGQISKVEFFAEYLIPRFDSIDTKLRIKFVCQLLTELTALLSQDTDGILSNVIETTAIFPTMSGELKSIDDLYDPEIDEFMEIMDDSFFPAIELQDPQPLSALRSIGLQRALSRRSILSLAVSLESDQLKIAAGNDGFKEVVDLDKMCDKLRSRSIKFFQYVDAHMDQLVSPATLQRKAHSHAKKTKTRNKGIRFLRNFLGDDRLRGLDALNDDSAPTPEELEEQAMEQTEIEDFKAKLGIITWIPVCEDTPHPVAPWYKQGERILVASSQNSRPTKQMWLCSSQFHIIKCPVHSQALRGVLGWDKRLPIDTIAFQLKEISRMFEKQSDSGLKPGGEGETHVVWSAVYSIYQVLSTFFETDQSSHRSEVLAILSGNGKYVWVGDRFVSSSHVATVAVVNAEPYLYTIPNELIHFRPFLRAIGVRERFALADYVHVLGAMYKECLAEASTDTGAIVNPLSGDKLTTVIGLIQLICDTLQHHSDYELFAPDRNGILDFAANLTYDDAPWLDKRDYETSSATTRFIHPKISNEVAARIGSRSLRSQLLTDSGHEAMSFGGEGDVEAFGQTEALTKRIAHILEQYPDGPNIISELIQNADDARATRVCIMFNSCTYGTSSLLSPAMANDGDFINLARIGQASKLQRATTTGRFGLGFNSVYHFTDLPSIVSAKSIVMFDPHATHLPGISAANPGIKIRFANANIVKQFPDQFAPFKNVFGCDLEHHYKGTLFRFPLRTSALAESSEIKRRGYSHNEILDLFRSFQVSIIDTMLFLRNVRKVEVYLQTSIDQPPKLLYDAEVPEEDRGEAWRKIDRFMRNDALPESVSRTTELSAKRDFYARLRSTPTEDLPSVTQVLHIYRRQLQGLQESYRRFGGGCDASMDQLLKGKDEEQMDSITETYLVCNQIGGGKAREMACATENESLKLIPWVGIAGRIDGIATEGRAFCFLPLPVRVGLPVHINGYFELSSNRRDIWHGDDMTGDGKLRSEWNASLLVDAVAPAYLSFLMEAKAMCEVGSSQYLSFFPTKLPVGPWDVVALELFRIMKNRPVFFAYTSSESTSLGAPNRSVAPSACILVDDSLADWKTLEAALGMASLVTVILPEALRSLLIELEAVYGAMTPDFFRQLTRQGNFLPLLDRDALRRVVQFCLSDCQGSRDPSAIRALNQLPLLPLKDGNFGVISFDEHHSDHADTRIQQYFFGNVMEEQLLDDFPHRLVRKEFKELFDQVPLIYKNANLSVVDLSSILDIFLPHILSRCWGKIHEGIFTLEATSLTKQGLSKKDWIRLLWTYVETQLSTTEQIPQVFLQWPLVPIICEEGHQWVSLSANICLVLAQLESALVSSGQLSQLQQALAKVGIYMVDTLYISGEKVAQWLLAHKYVHKLSSNGVLAALSQYQFRHERRSFDDMFAETTTTERQVLCDFFCHNSFDAVSNDYQPIIFELPIFPVYSKLISSTTGAQENAGTQFVSLRRGGYLPDQDADSRILGESFYRAEKEATRRFLRDCGIDEWSYTKILLDYVFPQLLTLEAVDSKLVDSILISALETLPFHQRNDSRFREVVRTHSVIPSRKRVFRSVNQLHDPSVSALSDLVGENSLPADAFSTPAIVEILRTLGLRTGLSCHAVLESARSIEAMSDENDKNSKAVLKAQSLLTIVNEHFDTMISKSKSGDTLQEGESTEAIQDIVTDLSKVQWLPVCLEAPDPAMPWRSSSKRKNCFLPRFSSASNTRQLKDAWLCSYSMDLLDGELTSQELITAFGWKEQIDPFVIAKQLEAIGLKWEDHRREMEAGGIIASPAWRFPLSEVHQMYEQLEGYRLSDEDGWEMSPVHRKLANALWVWTGEGFAYPCQIAIDADASLQPLLYSCPSEHIISRSLLVSFGLKEKFTTVDYLETIMRLPQNAVLSEKQIAACLRIYEIIGENTPSLETALNSFVSQEMVLLDHSNRLLPAIQLTFDDMEWNESREVRRGATFVSKKIPKDVAKLLGAVSLHSKLAQTSVTSRRVVCPPARALQNILPPRSEWHYAFLWETILAAERFGGSQIDFFLDTRHHSSQRVIQPSLQTLQDEALCIHIHGMVLSENDVNNLFHGESSRAGLLSGFMASDCMQVLSGDGFYILDPTGYYLSSSTGAGTFSASSPSGGAGIGRRYEVLSQDFIRYPDQLLPFTTLPSCPSNVSRGTQSTLIRFPWRKTGSTVSSYVMDSTKADKLISFLKAQLYQTLIFTESVHRISVWSVGKESEFASHCHGEVSLDSHDHTLRKRNMTRQNQEWKKKFSLQSFFKSPVIPENQMEFAVNLELENHQYRDTWLFADNIGLGRSRDLACNAVHEMLHSTPYVSVACHIFRDGSPAPRLRGHVYKIVDTNQKVGLPVHINGCFKKTIKDKHLALTTSSSQDNRERGLGGTSGSEQQVAAGWNRILLEDGVSDAYVKLLMVAKRRYESSFPKSLYNIWPTLQKVASFAQLHFPAFDIPSRIIQDCSRLLPSRIYAVTPKVMRRFLRSVSSSEVHSDVCLSLLEYCLSDLPFPLPSDMDPVWSEFHGLSLLPLEDGSIGVLRVNQRRTSYVLASFNQIELLRPLGHLFVSIAASRILAKYFSDSRFISVFGLIPFSIKTLSDNIEKILPSSWKNEAFVEWDPSSPLEIDEVWLYRFWQVVHFERRSLGYFSSWPLIPVKGSRLVSCGRMDMAVCVWDGSADSEVSARIAGGYQDSVTQQEQKMTGLDAERKKLMELSTVKFGRDKELTDEIYSDVEVESEGGNAEVDRDDERGSDDLSRDEEEQLEDVPFPEVQNEENSFNLEDCLNDDENAEAAISPRSISLALDNLSNSEEDADSDAETAQVSEGFAVPVYAVEDQSHEFCSRETLHNFLSDLNIAMVELAYLSGQENGIVPRSADLGLAVLDGIFASDWRTLRWAELSEADAILMAEFFSHNGDIYGGYNRIQVERLKQLPIFVNIGNLPCAIQGGQDFFLIPPGFSLADIPLPPYAQQRFLKSNPRLNAFYKDLGVEEMSDSKLLIYVLPMYDELLEPQRDQILLILLQKWPSLRGSAELAALLRMAPLFRNEEGDDARYLTASAYCDPRNSVLAAIYKSVPGKFPAQRFRTSEWLDLMAEIGLQTEVTVEIFVECAQRIDEQCSGKQALTPEDDSLITMLHQFFVQNFDKFDRSRSFFERITPLAFAPATLYEPFSALDLSNGDGQPFERQIGQFMPRTVVRKYSDCATPEDQALVYSTMPILANVALPPRVLYSRLGIQSPPPQDQVVAHLLTITNGDRAVSSRSLDWQFFLPMIEVFQAIFKFLQDNWGNLGVETQQKLTRAAIIPIGSTLVKGSRLFFHLRDNLSPLMFEVPRAFGAYDALFRHMGSKEVPEVYDYIRLLRDLNEECCGQPLNLNELIASARAIDLLATAMSESSHRLSLEEKTCIFLPSSTAVMQSMLGMAYNDSSALCSSIDLTELHVVHPRISTRCCKILGVPGITGVVIEELDGEENSTELLARDDIAHFNSILVSKHFADGLRKIITAQHQKASSYDAFGIMPDFEELNQRIVNLATFEVKCVTKLHSRFIAKLDFPARRFDVTKMPRRGSLSFLDQENKRIYIAKRTLEARTEMGMRASHLVARCINQLLGGVLQDCSVLESILMCDEVEIPHVLQQLDIYEDPVLIVEKLRGVLGQPLSEADCANVELAPLRSCLPGELVGVEDESGTLCYGKILHEQLSDVAGVSQYEVKVSSTSTRWILATQLYFFRSARVGTSNGDSNRNSRNAAPSERHIEGLAADYSDPTTLPASVVAVASASQDGQIVPGFSRAKAPASVVSSANVLSAVNDLLSRLNVTLDTSVEDLMAENLRLQRRLEVAEAGRRAATAQIDAAIRERKDVQDSLVCAVCLENKVNRVLIPCGHIYCASCVEQLPRPSCPICRQNIATSSAFHVPS
ncbi:unnamed protein product [Phytophthora fragariaefolia]|uniref:Unnamed protein product n=1 Tax=Phytophthora fragariaefolia TaxID=1490495 RepID=A0A9W7CSK0_9STRA|nr:unnamed protein product [Phytophthora fragariaefolia]